MSSTAKRAAIVTLVAVSIVVLALALWKIKVVIALLFLGIIVAAAMRPGVDWLHKRRARPARPRRPHPLRRAARRRSRSSSGSSCRGDRPGPAGDRLVRRRPASTSEATHSTRDQARDPARASTSGCGKLPSGSALVHPARHGRRRRRSRCSIGIFFMFAVGAYWIFERDKHDRASCSRWCRASTGASTRDTWVLIDQKLGAFVRGQLLLIVFVAVVLSLGFWAIGLPYWILIGSFAGVFEIVPVIGPLVAGALAVGVGLTQSWHIAAFAAGWNRARRAADRGLRRHPARARPCRRALAARRARLGDGGRDPASAASTCCSRSRSRRCSRRSST